MKIKDKYVPDDELPYRVTIEVGDSIYYGAGQDLAGALIRPLHLLGFCSVNGYKEAARKLFWYNPLPYKYIKALLKDESTKT